MNVSIDTETIRARKGQGLWGDTITRLCDEVDHLNDLINRQAEASMAKDDEIADLTAERDDLAERVAELTETVDVLSDDDAMAAIAEAEGE